MKRIFVLIAAALLSSSVAFAATSTTPVFQIRLVLDAPSKDSEPMTIVSSESKEVVNVQKAILLDHTAVKSAGVRSDHLGHAQIEVTFTAEGRKRFAELTRENVGHRLAIVIDGRLYCAPVIRTEVPGGKAEISGNFSKEEAHLLAAKIIEAIKKN